MNSKLTRAIMAVCTLLAAGIAQSSSRYVKLGDIKGEVVASSAPAIAVLGMSLLPYPIALPFGSKLYVSPDVVTIWDSDLKLPLGLSSDVIFYAQKLSLSGASTKVPKADLPIKLRGFQRDGDRRLNGVRMSATKVPKADLPIKRRGFQRDGDRRLNSVRMSAGGGFVGGLSGRFRLPTQGGIVVGNPADT